MSYSRQGVREHVRLLGRGCARGRDVPMTDTVNRTLRTNGGGFRSAGLTLPQDVTL